MSPPSPARLGRFELLTRIAKGGMAEIYLARAARRSPGDLVVVKRILPHLAEEQRFVQMFMEEAQLAKRIDHPNVVRIFEVGEDAGEHYIAMEYLGGPSVAAISRQARKTGMLVPYHVAVELVIQACEGLHAAHELRDGEGRPLGVVHRDISPQNLMLGDQGVVKLLDFGIAKARSSAVRTSTGRIKGKFPYMSPEQCRGEPLDRRTDIFSLGVVLCELVTGRRIFHRTTDLMVLKAITEEPLPDPRELYHQLPDEIREVILGALQRAPADRYPSAQQMATGLRHALRLLDTPTTSATLIDYVATDCSELVARQRALIARARATGPGRAAPAGDSGRGEADHRGATRRGKGRTAPSEEVPTRAVDRSEERRAAGAPARRRAGLLIGLALVAVALGTLAGLAYRHFGAARPSGPPLRFGLPPAFSADVGQAELGPFLRYLERRLDRPVELVVPKDYVSLRRQLLRGEIHLANLPPLQLVLARRAAPGVKVVVSLMYEGMDTYQGYIIRLAGSSVRELTDLRGKRFCYVDRGSTSGYLLPRHYLRRNRLDPDTLFSATRFSGSHPAVMRDLLAGRCDAGAVYSGALLNASKLGIQSWRLPVLASTGELPNDAYVAAPQLKPATVAKLRAVLLAIDPQEDFGRRTVGQIVFPITRFVTASGDYRLVEQIARAEGLYEK